jgi:hypothetical protein
LCWRTAGTALKLQEFLEREMERDEEPFDLDDDFVAGGEEEDYDRFDRRKQAVKKGKAAWSKLEDVLAEKRLQKELRDYYEDQ